MILIVSSQGDDRRLVRSWRHPDCGLSRPGSKDAPAEEEPAAEAENAPDEEVAAEETSEEPKAEASDEEAAE